MWRNWHILTWVSIGTKFVYIGEAGVLGSVQKKGGFNAPSIQMLLSRNPLNDFDMFVMLTCSHGCDCAHLQPDL